MKWVGTALALLVIGAYVYVLDFAVASLRAFIAFGLQALFARRGMKGAMRSAIVLGIIVAVNPLMAFNVGFQLSFATTFAIAHFAQRVHIKSKLLQGLWLTCLATVTTMPIMATITDTYSALAILYNLIYGAIMPVLFTYYALFAYWQPLAPVGNFLAEALIVSLKLLVQINLLLSLRQVLSAWVWAYYLCLHATVGDAWWKRVVGRVGTGVGAAAICLL